MSELVNVFCYCSVLLLLQVCDDVCRVEACGNDGSDCDEGAQCVEGSLCRQIYRFWNFLGDGNKWNTTYFCDAMWPRMMDILVIDNWSPVISQGKQCEEYMDEYDYNGDDHMCFRELVPLAYDAMKWPALLYHDHKGTHMNCSECWGMDNYNL